MILLIHGYGTRGEEQRQRSIVSSAIVKLTRDAGMTDLQELNIAKVRIDTYVEKEGLPEIVYIARNIKEQEDVGQYLKEKGVKVISYVIGQMYYTPQRVPGNTENTNVYRLNEKVLSDREQRYNPRKYKRVQFVNAGRGGYKVEVEDVKEYDYDVILKERYSPGKERYARNKGEIREIINSYRRVQIDGMDNDKAIIRGKREQQSKLNIEIDELKDAYGYKVGELGTSLRILEEAYNEGIR